MLALALIGPVQLLEAFLRIVPWGYYFSCNLYMWEVALCIYMHMNDHRPSLWVDYLEQDTTEFTASPCSIMWFSMKPTHITELRVASVNGPQSELGAAQSDRHIVLEPLE